MRGGPTVLTEENMQLLWIVGGTVLLFLLIIVLFSCIAKLLMRRKKYKKITKRIHYAPAKIKALTEIQMKRLAQQGYVWRKDLFESESPYSDYLVWGAGGVFHICFTRDDVETCVGTVLPHEIRRMQLFLHTAVSYTELPFLSVLVTVAKEPAVIRKGEVDGQPYAYLNADDIADFILRKKQTVFNETDRKLLKKPLLRAYRKYRKDPPDETDILETKTTEKEKTTVG